MWLYSQYSYTLAGLRSKKTTENAEYAVKANKEGNKRDDRNRDHYGRILGIPGWLYDRFVLESEMRLRDAISEYSKWIAVVYGALVRQHITPFEAFEMVKQLKTGLTAWIGEELLNHLL